MIVFASDRYHPQPLLQVLVGIALSTCLFFEWWHAKPQKGSDLTYGFLFMLGVGVVIWGIVRWLHG